MTKWKALVAILVALKSERTNAGGGVFGITVTDSPE